DLLATWAWDGGTRIWDPISGTQPLKTPGNCINFSRDDRRLGYTFADMKPEIGIWEVATGSECRALHAEDEQGSGPKSVDVHPEGRLMATAGDDGVRLWDLALPKQIVHLPLGWSRAALFHPSGDSLITAGKNGVRRWPLEFTKDERTLRVGPPKILTGPASTHHNCATLSRDGQWLAVVMTPQQAVVINLDKPEVTVTLGNHPGIDNAVISPDGRWVATGTQHGTGVKVWDARCGKLGKDIAGVNSGWGLFTPGGKHLFTGSAGMEMQVWNV